MLAQSQPVGRDARPMSAQTSPVLSATRELPAGGLSSACPPHTLQSRVAGLLNPLVLGDFANSPHCLPALK